MQLFHERFFKNFSKKAGREFFTGVFKEKIKKHLQKKLYSVILYIRRILPVQYDLPNEPHGVIFRFMENNKKRIDRKKP